MGSRQQLHGTEDPFSAAADAALIYYNGHRITMPAGDIFHSNDGANVCWPRVRPLLVGRGRRSLASHQRGVAPTRAVQTESADCL